MKRLRLLLIFGFVLLIAGIALLIHFFYQHSRPIPAKIIQQANFGIWYPDAAAELTVQAKTIEFKQSGQDKLVSFSAQGPLAKLDFTEQAEPDSFNDVPQVYDQLIDKLRGYTTFTSTNGTVSLTRPEELKGGQAAVMNSRGTLMFVKTDHELSADQWRTIFNKLDFAN